jgi:hypothetical protein
MNNIKKIQIIIYCFSFTLSGGGNLVLYNLAKIINDLNHSIFYAKMYDMDQKNIENNFCNNYIKQDELINLVYDDYTILFYPEFSEWVTPIITKYGIIMKFFNNYRTYDNFINYRTYDNNILIYGWEFPLYKSSKQLCFPYYKNNYYNKNKNKERTKTCFIIKKGWVFHSNMNFFHPIDSIEIDRLDDTNDTIVDIFNECKYFYCYDPHCIFAMYAVACGCITIIYPLKDVSKEEYFKTRFFYRNNKIHNYGIAYGNSEEEIKFATDTLAEGEFMYKELFKSYEDTVVDFLNDLKIFFKEKSLIQ